LDFKNKKFNFKFYFSTIKGDQNSSFIYYIRVAGSSSSCIMHIANKNITADTNQQLEI
jgi:hypothetical protein